MDIPAGTLLAVVISLTVVPDMVANLSKVGPLGVAPPPDDMDARPAPRPISPRPGVHDNGDVEIP